MDERRAGGGPGSVLGCRRITHYSGDLRAKIAVELPRRGRGRVENGAGVVSAHGPPCARGRPRVTVVGEEKGIDVRISLDDIQMASA